MRETGTGKVKTVIDPLTFQLTDGRTIRLSGIDIPGYDYFNPGEFSILALDVLKDFLEGETVHIFQTARKDLGRLNRMGHDLAQIQRDADNAWAQGTLISLGLARVRTTQRNPDMAQQMYALESRAREEALGFWSMPEFQIMTEEKAGDSLNEFRIVEGKIEAVALNNNRIYLNFGQNWREDFTVSIAPANKRYFQQAGMDPMQWGGRHVRVRGWIEEYNGPYIEIDHPEAIEFTDTKGRMNIQAADPLRPPEKGPMVKSISNP